MSHFLSFTVVSHLVSLPMHFVPLGRCDSKTFIIIFFCSRGPSLNHKNSEDKKLNFYKAVYPQMMRLARDALTATYQVLDSKNR